MKEYDITIKETLEKSVTVMAATREEAEAAVKKAYYNSEYVLDAENFSGVGFAVQAEREIEQMQKETMDVLLVKPFMYPQAIKIGKELEDLQSAIGGDIETTYPFDEPVAIICNDEGKINGSELNRSLRDDKGEIYDIVAGDFLVVGLTEDDFCSLNPEQMKKFKEHFHQPEMYIRMGKSIMAVPVPDDRVRKADVQAKADMISHKSSPKRDAI